MGSSLREQDDASMIDVRDDGHFRRIVIDRPERANALTMNMLAELSCAIDTAGVADVAAIVLSGGGERHFCSGADLSDLAEATRHDQHVLLQRLVSALSQSSVPIITLIQGRSLGAACALIALSDIVIARDDSVLGFPEMQFGMYPALVHAVLLEKLPPHIVFQICVSGRALTAEEALALGLVTEIVDRSAFADGALDRLAFYANRMHGVKVGRELRRVWRSGQLDARLTEAEEIIGDNLNDLKTQQLLAQWQKRNLASAARSVLSSGGNPSTGMTAAPSPSDRNALRPL